MATFSLAELSKHIPTDWWNARTVLTPDRDHFYAVFFECPSDMIDMLNSPLESDPDVSKLDSFHQWAYKVSDWFSKVLSPDEHITPAVNLMVRWNEVDQNDWNKRLYLWDYKTFSRQGLKGIVFVVSQREGSLYTDYKDNFSLDIGQLLSILKEKSDWSALTFGLYKTHWDVSHIGEKKMGTPADYPLDIPSPPGDGNGYEPQPNPFASLLNDKYLMITLGLLAFGGALYVFSRAME